MGDSEEQSKSSKDVESERQKTLEELKALRQKRLESSGKPISTPTTTTQPKKQMNTSVTKTAIAESSESSEDNSNAEIASIRATRMEHDAYHDILRLRKQADVHEHEAAKYITKSKSFETKAQNSLTKAVRNRKKAGSCRESIKDIQSRISELEKEMKSAAIDENGSSPERVKLKIAKQEKKTATLEQRAKKYEAKAALLNEKASLFKSKSASNIEQSKIHESEAKNLTKRADKLENLS